MQEVTEGYMRYMRYRRIQEVHVAQEGTGGYRRVQEVAGRYRRVHEVNETQVGT